MNSYTCPACEKTAFPRFVMANNGRLVLECANDDCRRMDTTLGPSDFSQGIAAVGSGEPGWSGKQLMVVEAGVHRIDKPISQPPQMPPAPARATFQPPPSRQPSDVIAWIEDRANWLQAEQARLEGEIATAKSSLAGVRAESRRLEKMLKAGRRSEVRSLPPPLSDSLRPN